MVWHIAKLDRIKKIPPLRDLLADTKPPLRTDGSNIEELRAWVRSMGGTVLTRQ